MTDPLFIAAALAAVCLAGVSKGGFGGGAAFAATPILALASSPSIAVGVLLPVFCLMDVITLYKYRRLWSVPNAVALMLACVPGVLLGWLTYGLANDAALKILIGVTGLGFLTLRWLKPAAPQAFSPVRAWLLGAGAGFTSFVAHAGGPLIAIALLPQRLPRTQYQATTVVFFWWVNLIKLGPYAALGLLSPVNMTTSALLTPVALASVALGAWLHRRVSEQVFFRLITVFLLLVSVKLCLDGAAFYAVGSH